MKRINKFLGCIQVIILWSLCSPLFGQNVQVNFASNRDSVGTEGDIVRVPILLDTVYTNNMVGENIIALKLTFSHDNELTPLSFDFAGGLIESWSKNTTISSSNKRFTITAAGVSPIALDSGLLFYVDYQLNDVASERNPNYRLYTGADADNYFNEGGYDFTMDYGQIKITPILQLSVSASPIQITDGDSTKIYASGGEAPYTYSLADPSFGSFVSTDYFLAEKYGFAEVLVTDVNGLQGSTIVEVRPFKLQSRGPEDPVFPGNDFEIAILTTDVSLLDIISGSFNFTLTNSDNVRLKSIISQGTLLEGASIETNEKTPNNYTLAFATTTVLSVGDTLLKFEFESDIDATNSYSLSIQNNIFFNDDLKGTNGSSQAAQFINVTAPNLSYPFANYITNEQIQFTGSAGQAPYNWSVSDETIGTIDGEGLLTLHKGGDISVIIKDALGISNSTDLFIYDGRVDIADHTAPAETQYNLPVEITELAADRGFSSFAFEVQYDPTKIDFVGIDQSGTLLEGFTIAQNQIAENKVRIVGASTDTRTAAGVLTNLTFDLLSSFTESQTTSISLPEIKFDEGEPVVIAINGSIKVGIAPTSGDTDLIINEDENYVFMTEDIVYAHPESTPINSLRIESLPANGVLTYFSSNVTLNQTIAISSIDQFRYLPEANANGTSFDAFEFRVNDGINFSNYRGSISIDVNAVNDPPVFEVSDSFITTTEDFTQDSVVTFTLNEVPLDEQGETVTYTMSPETVDFATVTFDPVTMTVTFSSIENGFGSQVFEITADDGQTENNTFSKTVTFTVNAVDDAPTMADQVFSVNENTAEGTVIGTIEAEDIDSDLLFSLDDGNTGDAFAIESPSGNIIVNSIDALDFETNPVFTLTVSLPHDTNPASATITINLNDVDEAVNQSPQITDQTFNIDENSTNGTIVGSVTSFDPDGDVITYAITAGNTNNAFAIDAASGELTVGNIDELDFETTPSFSLTVQVEDAELSASATITVDLNDVLDTNQPPTIADQTFSINENSANGSVVGTVVAEDVNEDTLTFSITAGNTNDAFAIDAASGVLTVADVNQLDFETTPTFNLTIQVDDAEFNAAATITVNLNDVDETVNQAPQIVDQTFSIDENSANGTAVGTVDGFDPDGDAITFSITAGNTNSAFALDGTTGELTVADVNQLDFETTPTFSLTIQVADAALNASATITVDLNDVVDTNQAPEISDQTFAINENSANGTAVGTVVASDPDGDAITFSITAGNTNNAFALDGTTGELTVADVNQLDFETTPTFNLTVQVADAELNASATITINLNDLDDTNQAPEIADQTFTIDENSANGTAVGSVIATDPNEDALTYSITAGNTNNAFAIDAASGALTVADVSQLDFETTPTFSLTVQVADAELNASATITVNLNDVDETVNQAPQIVDQTFSIDENSANGTAVGTVDGFDPDGDALTYSITTGNTNNAFALDATTGELTVADESQLDFETTPSFSLAVQVADAVFNASATITVNLNDLVDTNQAPAVADQTFAVDENSANGTAIGSVIASDPDGDALTYSITAGNTNNAFAIDAASGALTVADVNQLDFETTPSFSLTLQVADAELNANATITVNLNDVDETVNQAPQIVDQIFSIDENSVNGTAVGTVDAFDPDGDAITFSITAGNTNNAFALDGTTGELTVADVNQLDFETTPTFNLTIQVADAALNANATITINLNDVDDTNQAPEIANQTFSIDENSANGSSIGTVVASDPDGDALTYTITAGNTNDAFVIDAANGALTVNNSTELDFETNPTFSLTVQVADADLNTNATITINLNDVDDTNQAPEIANQTFSIDENSANGTVVATVVASDPDGDALTYTITAGNTNNAFAINGATGALTVANVEELDFETTPTFNLTVQVADADLNTNATITINLNDVDDTNQAPQIANQTFSIDENSANGTVVANVVASDPDGDALTYAIIGGNNNNAFIIDSSTGAVTVNNSSALDFETNPTYSLNILVADASANASAIITINLNDVVENALGLEDEVKSKLKFYPNPMVNQITLEYPIEVIEGKWSLITTDGKEVMKGSIDNKRGEIDVSNFTNGVYILKIMKDDVSFSLTLIKR